MKGKESSGTTDRAIELELLSSTPGLFDDSYPNAIKVGTRCSSNSSVNFQRLQKKKEKRRRGGRKCHQGKSKHYHIESHKTFNNSYQAIGIMISSTTKSFRRYVDLWISCRILLPTNNTGSWLVLLKGVNKDTLSC